MLAIKKINITNFRQYKSVNLSFDSSSSLYLFIGKNGIGKSNFLNAICWCLYDEQPFKFHDEGKKILNEESLSENEFDQVSVSLEVEMDGKTYLFKRAQRETQDSKLTVMIKQGEDWGLPVPNPNIIVNSFLPKSLRQFFLFDGEAVQNFYKGSYWEKLKFGVWKVSNVELLDNAIEHVNETIKTIRKEMSRDVPETNNLEEKLTSLEEERKGLEQNLTEKNEEERKLKNNKKELEVKFKTFQKYRSLIDQKENITTEIEESEENRKEYERQLNDLIINNAPFWYIKETLEKTIIKINSEYENGTLPPKIRNDFITELIDKGICICGTKIEKNTPQFNCLNNLLIDNEQISKRSFLLDDRAEILSIIRSLKNDLPENFKNILSNISKERIRKDNNQQKLKEISQLLINAPDEEVGEIESTLQMFDEQLENCHKTIGQNTGDLAQTNQQITNTANELEKLNNNKKQIENNKKIIDTLNVSFVELTRIRAHVTQQVLNSVSRYTNKNFKEMIWKKDDFDHVSFDEEYRIEVVKHGQNQNCFDDLSTGENKVLSLATLKALAQMSGFDYMPIFIDGPLENLDEEVKENFLKIIPSFLTNKQVFVFSLDSKIIIDFGKEKIDPDKFFQLSRVKNSTSTVIKKFDVNSN